MKKVKMMMWLVAIAIGITSCSNEEVDVNTHSGENKLSVNDMIGIVSKSIENEGPEDSTEMKAFVQGFKNLTANQLDEFTLKFSDISSCNESNKRAHDMGFSDALSYRKAVNKAAIDIYKKPFNKLTMDEMDDVFANVGSGEKGARTNGCPVHSYSGSFPLGTYNWQAQGWTEVTKRGQNDCDLEFRLPRNSTAIGGRSRACQWALSASNRSYRTTRNNIYVFVGKGRMTYHGCIYGWGYVGNQW